MSQQVLPASTSSPSITHPAILFRIAPGSTSLTLICSLPNVLWHPLLFYSFLFLCHMYLWNSEEITILKSLSIQMRTEGNLPDNTVHRRFGDALPHQFAHRELVFSLSVEVDHNNGLCHSQVTFYKLYEITTSWVQSLKWLLFTFVSVKSPSAAALLRRLLCYYVLRALNLSTFLLPSWFVSVLLWFCLSPFSCYSIQPSFAVWSLFSLGKGKWSDLSVFDKCHDNRQF